MTGVFHTYFSPKLRKGYELYCELDQADPKMGKVRRLINSGASLKFRLGNKNGSTALMVAATHGHSSAVKLMLDKGGVEINATDSLGRTALMCAIDKNDAAIVQLLAEKCADLDIVNTWQETALKTALTKNNQSIARILLSHGAKLDGLSEALDTIFMLRPDIMTKVHDGETLPEFCRRYGREDFARMLEEHAEKQLQLAAAHEKKKMEEFLRAQTILQKDIKPVKKFTVKAPKKG